MKTIVFGVLYPKMTEFWQSYAECINSQTDKEFELWLVNNNFSDLQIIRKSIDIKIPVKILEIKNSGCFGPKLWQEIIPLLIKEVKKHNIEAVIFSDTDDTFEIDRVEKTKIAFSEGREIVFTELVPISENGLVKGEGWYQKNVPELVKFSDIITKNLLGLGHTAIMAGLLSKVFSVDSDLVVTDWWIFSSLLIQGYQAHFLGDCISYYRQHDENIAGIRSSFDAKYVNYGINLKLQHYSKLLSHLSGESKNAIQEELEKIKILAALVSDPRIMARYMMNLNNFAKREKRGLFWREEIDLKFVPTEYLAK
jgi:hypothetical protein